MENPDTWGPLEWELNALLHEYDKMRTDGAIGYSLVAVLAAFIRGREEGEHVS